MADLHLSGSTLLGALTMKAALSLRVNHGIPYLIAAARYSRLVGQIESANANSEFGEFWEEMRDHAVACVFFADAAIESYANELYADAPTLFPQQFIAGLDVLWPDLERRKSSIDKLDLALSLRSKPKLDRKLPLLKAVHALGLLRNELTHFKPEWSHEKQKHAQVSSEMQGYFATSRWHRSESIFPNACVGHGATTWIVDTAITFLKEFERLADLPDRTKWQDFQGRLLP